MQSRRAKPNRVRPRVLVTGAGGFLGGHISRHFGSRDCPVAAVGRFRSMLDIGRNYPNLSLLGGMTLPDPAFADIVARFQPDLLVHCAGTSSVADSVRAPYADFQRTVDVCAFALETVRRHAPRCRFIHLSSASVYGQPKRLPIDETAPCAPLSPYGFHKRMCETLVEEYGSLHGLSTAIVRIFSAYGENLRRQVVFDLCGKILAARNGRFDVIGTGKESRDFIHASDVALAVETIHSAQATGIFNLGSGIETTVESLVGILCEELGTDCEPRYGRKGRPGDPLNWRADISRLAALGYRPKLTLSAGLRRYCRWLRSESASANVADWTGLPATAPYRTGIA